MYTLHNLIKELQQAVSSDDLDAVANVVRRAVRERPVAQVGASQLLYSQAGLTLLHAVVNPGFVSPPHDHRTWAVIGVYEGQEDNTLYRLKDNRRIEQCCGLHLSQGKVLTLDADAIHRISNPLNRKLVALHVYGKNIFEIERSAWDPATGSERPFKLRLDNGGMIQPSR
jgi:predicted metal-dependent enzyme (double-stranded beta helix superfamily)